MPDDIRGGGRTIRGGARDGLPEGAGFVLAGAGGLIAMILAIVALLAAQPAWVAALIWILGGPAVSFALCVPALLLARPRRARRAAPAPRRTLEQAHG